MKNKMLFIIFINFSIISFAQIGFVAGYYIDNSNNKVNCLIRNVDWKNNPSSIKYKLDENDIVKEKTINNIKEFAINNETKYIKFVGNIDRATEDINRLSDHRNPDFKKETLFLKVLIEGNANLYYYEDGNLRRYFFNKGNSKIEQLIYKKIVNSKQRIVANKTYIKQIWENLKCDVIKLPDLRKINYRNNDLVKVFVKYNKCTKSNIKNYKTKKKLFNLSLKPGVSLASLFIENSISEQRNADFGTQMAYRFGIEGEFILPFNKNKWSIVFEPTYQKFNVEKEVRYTNNTITFIRTNTVKVDYSSIEIPFGVRHYFFINDNSKIFINGLFIFDLSFNSKISDDTTTDLKILTNKDLAFGLGYKYKRKISLELRYNIGRELLSDYLFWDSKYQSTSLIFGYTIF